jgi:hypothetical protein
MMASQGISSGTFKMDRGSEAAGLRLYIVRLRAAFRYAMEPRVEAILRDTIAEMEERLEQIEAEAVEAARPVTMKASQKN